MTEEQTTFVDVPGGRLWTATSGSGIPVVLAHGGPGLSDNLGPVAAMLDDLAEVHRYDQRGGGRSSTEGPFDIRTFVDDLEALRRHSGHEAWVVGGHSWGAALALFYAMVHPARTLGVIHLAGPGIRWGLAGRIHEERMRRLTPEQRAELETLAARRARWNTVDQERFLRLVWSTDFADPETADRCLDEGPLYRFPRADKVTRQVEADWQRRLEIGVGDDLRALDVPVLVVHGEADPIPLRGAREVADLAPLGRWAPIPGAGHSPWLEQPEILAEKLRDFVRQVGA